MEIEKMVLLQAFPTEGALADALRRQKPLMSNKKRLSRLKRIILKERGEKGLIDARELLVRANSALDRARACRDRVQEQLKVCTSVSEHLCARTIIAMLSAL